MNFLLSLNKKYFLIITFIIIIFFISLIFVNFLSSLSNSSVVKDIFVSNADITDPKFSINSANQKILVTADEGNFIGTNQILLKNNVVFKSDDFSIETDNVIFDRIEKTASSKTKSIFKSKNTKISSNGFDIYDNGKKIKFIGKSIVVLK